MAELDLEGGNGRLCDKPFSFSSLEKTVVKKPYAVFVKIVAFYRQTLFI
jgi:hypothetical protein